MKNRKILLLTLSILFLASCDLYDFLPLDDHTHIFSLQYDTEHHFYQCDCGEKKDIEEHIVNFTTVIVPTETKNGLMQGNCTVCNCLINKTIPCTHTHSYDTSIYNDSYHYLVCSCGDQIEELHSLTDWVETKSPGLTSNGEKTRVCRYCDYKQTEIIPMLSHTCSYSSTLKYTELYHYKECSCGNKLYFNHYHNSHKIEGTTLKSICECNHSITRSIENDINNNYGYTYLATINQNYAKFYKDVYDTLNLFRENKLSTTLTQGVYTLPGLNFSKYNLTFREAINIKNLVHLENPLFYFMSNVCYYTSTDLSIGIISKYLLSSERSTADAYIKNMILECVTNLDESDNEVTTAYNIHQFLIERVDYAYESDGVTPQDDDWAHSIIGMATKKGSVCESYAKSFKYLCDIFGLENLMVTGTSNGSGHAWNMININNNWYHTDVTWDDQNIPILKFFGSSNEKIKKDHTIESGELSSTSYLYELPESNKSLELVALYENNNYLGYYTSIDDAFSNMNNLSSDYNIILNNYKKINSSLYEISDYSYTISKSTPSVKSINIVGCEKPYTANTTIDFTNSCTINAKLSLDNVYLNTNGFNVVLNNTVTFNGYSGGFIGTSPSGTIISNTTKK